MDRLPNIVIFMADQWRGDWTGAAGHPFIRTPNHDALAEEGAVFTNAFTTHPICGPSRCSFCTGWYPHTRGHRGQEALIRPDEPHLFAYLKQAGYHVAWGGKNDMLEEPVVAETVDTRLGISGACRPWGQNPYEPDDDRFYSFYFGPMDAEAEQHPDVKGVRAAQEFLRNPPAEPFCLWVNVGFPHPPYAAPEPWASLYGPEEVDDPITVEYANLPKYLPQIHRHSRLDRCDNGHIRKMRAMYAGMITMVDSLLGDLMGTLGAQGLADDTAVVFTSDHGNYAGDYGCPEKWHTAVHDAIARIPLAVRLPGGAGRPGVREALCQHIDVFATVLDLAGVTPAWPHFGQSLLPVIHGQREEHRDAVFVDCGANLPHEHARAVARQSLPAEPTLNPYESFRATLQQCPEAAGRTVAVRTAEWKYVWRQADVEELYDLNADPHETRNLLGAPLDGQSPYRDVIEALRARMLRWAIETGDAMPVGINPEGNG